MATKIGEETGYATTTKIQRPKKKTIRGWIQVTKNLILPSESTGPVFKLPNGGELVPWQEKKMSEFEGDSSYTEIHQVENFDSFVTTLNRVLTSEREASLDETPDTEVLRMETNLQGAADNAFTRCCEIIDECIAQNVVSTIILTGPQACGKSTIVSKLIAKYGVEVIAHCSADIHMGEKFNPMKIERVHKLCQKDCFNAIREGRFAVIDNTSMIAEHRTIYAHVSKTLGAKVSTIAVAGEFWMSSDESVRKTVVDTLEQRSTTRAKNGGKIIERYVIENAIGKAVADIAKFNKLQTSGPSEWCEYYPAINPPRVGLSIDSQTLKYRSVSLNEKCQTLFTAFANSAGAPPNLNEMRLQFEVMRGMNDFYTTVVNPNELRKTIKDFKKRGEKFPEAKAIVIEGEPEVSGIGQVSSADGKHAIFAVVDWEGGQKYRESIGLERKHFHVTLAFENDDVHKDESGNDVDKSKVVFAV